MDRVSARPVVCGCCHGCAVSPAGQTRRPRPGRPPVPVAPGWHAGRAAREAAPATGVRGYSPPPPPVSAIRGLIDFHTHAAPDVFGRAVDDDELASPAAARQMEAVVFKSQTMGREVPGALLMG